MNQSTEHHNTTVLQAQPQSQPPLIKQYNEIKTKYPNSLVLFRVGDFFEIYGNDAILASKVLNIVVTKRTVGSSDVALAGFKSSELSDYLLRLIKAGVSVAVCDRVDDNEPPSPQRNVSSKANDDKGAAVTTTKANLTEVELATLKAILASDFYEQGRESCVWGYSIVGSSKTETKQIQGCLPRLAEKGLVSINDYNDEDTSVSITEAGYAALESNGIPA